MKSQKVLEDLHAAYRTPEATIERIINSVVGKKTLHIQKIQAGFDSEVYDITTDNNALILKIQRRGLLPYTQELWAMEQAQKVDIPVAEVLYCGKYEVEGEQKEIMVQSKVGGRPLNTIRDEISQSKFEHALQQAGQLLKKLHFVTTSGCWMKSKNNTWTYNNWEEFVRYRIKKTIDSIEQLEAAGLSAKSIQRIIEMNKKNLSQVLKLPLVLNHGDYMPEHMYVDEDMHIIGVIDFGDARGAPAIHDFGFIKLISTKIALDPFFRGYNDSRVENMKDVITAHALLLGLMHLSYHRINRLVDEEHYIKGRIESLLKEVS